jgi:hypothetical protein
MVTVPPPINTITTVEMFQTDKQAITAIAGVYSQMINGSLGLTNGYATILGGLSADEFSYYGTVDVQMKSVSLNQLLYNNGYTSTVWTGLYKTIYNANGVIEGIEGSTSEALTDSIRNKLTGEAKFVRAFCYFYLTNLFGDVPLVLTVDFNKTRYMSRTPSSEVYRQIIADLKEAQSRLDVEYPTTAQERIIPNKAVATAMLARTYLYTKDYVNAAAQATAIINNTSLYGLESDPDKVFLAASREAIWQLKQTPSDANYKNATAEANAVLPSPLATGVAYYYLTPSMLNAFEAGDIRRVAWLGTTTNNGAVQTWYPYKYKIGRHNAVTGAAPSEYYMVFRLAEMYLVRAEAAINGAPGGVAAAIADMNEIRRRADLTDLPETLTAEQATAALAQERRVELFAEWGHRWLDLKRTNKASAVLSAMPEKQPWAGDYQLLYPIPDYEVQINPRLGQNPGYN